MAAIFKAFNMCKQALPGRRVSQQHRRKRLGLLVLEAPTYRNCHEILPSTVSTVIIGVVCEHFYPIDVHG
eukprot:51747-Eustigmatos_ZCMA.PRE.1